MNHFPRSHILNREYTFVGKIGSQKTYNQLFLKIGVLLLSAFFIFLSWGVTHHQLEKNKTALLLGLEREQQNLCSLFAENLYQILEEKQTLALLVFNQLDTNTDTISADISQFLHNKSAFNRIVLYKEKGEPLYQSSPDHRNPYDQGRLRQRIGQTISSGEPLFLNQMDKGNKNSWQIPLLFPLEAENGGKMVMLLELDIGYLLNLLRDIDIGKTGKIAIYDDKNFHIASFESGGLVSNNAPEIPSNCLWLKESKGMAVFENSNGRMCQAAFFKIRDYPLMVLVSQEAEDYLTDFNFYRMQLFRLLGILTVFCLAGTYLLLKAIDKTHVYLEELTWSNKKNEELIRRLELEHQASTRAASMDALTGLHNRRLFVLLAEKKLSAAKRNILSYAVLFIDLDRFKTINDTLGHRVGDLILKEVAKRLVANTRESDIVSRFGGDEFVVMLSEMSQECNIKVIVEKIITAVSRPYFDIEGQQIHTSPSVGIAVYPRDGNNLEKLLINADAAMYKSKKAGRGEYRFFEASLNTVSLQKFELEQRMPEAIRDDEFICHYQPKIRLSDFRVIGLEALIRWTHPGQQIIYPNDFIDIAEKSGFIGPLGQWTLGHVCRQIGKWQSACITPVPVAINVSPLELQNPKYASLFIKTLKRFETSSEFIEIEIKENAFIEDKAVVIENLKVLSDNGVKISLDDFGKGFATLDNVRSLPINYLKIDRSFIKDICDNSSDNSIVYSTIILAQKLKKEIIAEGVETDYQLRYLKLAGCDHAQGYYFSRPVPEKEILEFLTTPIRNIAS